MRSIPVSAWIQSSDVYLISFRMLFLSRKYAVWKTVSFQTTRSSSRIKVVVKDAEATFQHIRKNGKKYIEEICVCK